MTLTKEWLLKTIAELEEERDATPGAVNEDADMALAAMKLALASLEAEPVAWISERNLKNLGKSYSVYVKHEPVMVRPIPLYTTPPAPVSVPDENGLLPCPFCGGIPEEDAGGCSEYDGHEHQDYSISCKSCGAEVYCAVGSFEKADIPCSCHHNAREVCVDKWNRRAAMLQGAEPVTTANKLPFEQWLSQQTGTIDVECGCVMTEVFFHWLRVAYEAGNSPVIPDGWVACSELMPDIGAEIFYFCQDDGLRDCGIVSSSNFSGKGDAELYVHAEGYDLRFGVDITHWMPLPAAPQQEAE